MESICYEDNIGSDFEYAYNQMNYVIVGTLIYGLGFTISAWFISRCLMDKETISKARLSVEKMVAIGR